MGNKTSSATAAQYTCRVEILGWQRVEKEERLHVEVGFPRNTACGEDSCLSDLVGGREGGRQTGQESKAGRNVVSAGDSLQPDPTEGSQLWSRNGTAEWAPPFFFFFNPHLRTPEDMLIDFTDRGKERGRETSISCLSYYCPTREWTCNPGTCPDQGSNPAFQFKGQHSNQLSHTGQGAGLTFKAKDLALGNPLPINHWPRSEGKTAPVSGGNPQRKHSCELLQAALTAAGEGMCQPAKWSPTASTTPSFPPWLPDRERRTPRRPGSTQRPQPPQKPLPHSVSFVKLNKVIFEETACQASQGVRMEVEVAGQSQRADPKPWQGQPLKGSPSVVMSRDWHPSSNRVAEPGFIGKSEERGVSEEEV